MDASQVAGALLTLPAVGFVYAKAAERLKARRLQHVIEAYEPLMSRMEKDAPWRTDWIEPTYCKRLAAFLHDECGLDVKKEALIPEAKIDVRFLHADAEWFVTVKNGLDPQQRKTLVGELTLLSDYIREQPPERRVVVAILVGRRRAEREAVSHEIAELDTYLDALDREHSARGVQGHVYFRILEVEIGRR